MVNQVLVPSCLNVEFCERIDLIIENIYLNIECAFLFSKIILPRSFSTIQQTQLTFLQSVRSIPSFEA